MNRYFCIAHYLTAGRAHGSCSFPIIAGDIMDAIRRARTKATTRGRSNVRVQVSLERAGAL